MIFLKNYSLKFFIFRGFCKVNDLQLKNLVRKLNIVDLNSRLFFFLFFVMLIEKKYFQLFYFYNFFFQNNITFYFSIDLINYFLIKLQNELELSLFIIKRGFLFNSSNFILSSKNYFRRKNLSNVNYKYFVYNSNPYDNGLQLLTNNVNLYKTLEFFKKNEINYYVNWYIRFLFYQNLGSLYRNSNFSGFFFNFNKKRYEIINYKYIKSLFLKFFNLLINSVFFNAIPFFIFPKYLEEEVFIFYSYILYIRTSILYNIKYTRWLVALRNLDNFQRSFGTPCFFFILDIIESFLTINPVKNFNLPVGALVFKNINANFFDYPIFIHSQSKNNIYLYFFFIMRLTFYSLNKRKNFFWGFFIKNKIIYELKKKLIDIK